MNYKSIILGLSVVFFSTCALAQTTQGNLEIIKDPRIDLLQKSRVYFENNPVEETPVTKENGTRGTVLGFRVQIYSGASRNEAYAIQARFQKQYEDIATYISYTQPNYRVKVGDFRSRSEAQAFMREVKKNYPMVFLFTEQVYVYY
ncbi:SPOR domain-containing protein [Albibacterium indicum]|uniref:SPOR domain-containing protein n=1 Tax=Albibacterium indicum TaxID=2292082 RepID=UPI000E471E5C|nr:SPOR domain-containing protein [Pedobacter indicus]